MLKQLGLFVAILALSSSLATACGSTAASAPGVRDYAARVQARIAAERSSETLLVRYNPTPCNCPAFEIRLQGRWHRVAFDQEEEEEPAVLALRAAITKPDAERRTYVLRGSLSDRVLTCGKGAIFVTMTPTEWVDGSTASGP